MDIQERVEKLSRLPELQRIWNYLDDVLIDGIAEATIIQQIPAPTFHELVRANHVLSRMGACGLQDTGIDEVHNTFGRIPGTNPEAPALLVAAHTDTVFGDDADLTIRHEADGRIYGPGLGDNSLGVAGLIVLADVLRQFRIRPRRDIWFLANSREEGLGDLGGIRQFYEHHKDHLGLGVILEGLALGRIYRAGIAVRRFHVTFHAAGGHSWQHFGQPSAVHAMLRVGARLTELQPTAEPRTTYNIGLVEGGHSINSLATDAGFYLDMRSQSPEELAGLEQQVREIIERIGAECDGVRIEIDVVGDRPAGAIDVDHELVRGASAALQAVGITPSYESGSTDANLLLAKGVPTVTIGLTHGGNAHRQDEYIETGPLVLGLRQLILLILAAAEWEPAT